MSKINILNADEQIALYNIACNMFSVGNYREALKKFELLVLLDASNLVYFKSVAGCYQQLKQYHIAILNYQYVYSMSSEINVDCLYYMGFCYYKLQDFILADKNLEKFISKISDNADNQLLLIKAQRLLNKIRRK